MRKLGVVHTSKLKVIWPDARIAALISLNYLVPWGHELGSWRLWTRFLEVMEVILVFMLRSWRLYQVPGGYAPAPAGNTTTIKYRAALAAKNERGTSVKSFKTCATLGHYAQSRDSDIKTLFWRRTLYPALASCSAWTEFLFSFLLISHPKYITGNK